MAERKKESEIIAGFAMEKKKHILVLNFGSTSSKIALYDGMNLLAVENYAHTVDELLKCKTKSEQIPIRKKALETFLQTYEIEEKDIALIVPRYPLQGKENMGHFMADDAFYAYDRKMLDTRFHIMFVAATVAYEVFGGRIPMAICDVMSYIQVRPEHSMTGIPQITRSNQCHIENTTALAKILAEDIDKPLKDLSFIMAHLGGGVSFSWSLGGIVRYTIFDGEGGFSPQRGGILPSLPLVDMCYSGEYTKEYVISLIKGHGGLSAYLNTTDCIEIEKRIAAGDREAELIYRTMAVRMAASIGEVAAIAKGKADCIVLSGGIAHSKYVTDIIKEHVRYIAPIKIYPGEFEMDFFAGFGLDVLNRKIDLSRRNWSEL